ncbi:hypothetical protein SH501x_005252 [Pirellulaceae bacterium SH501]
MSEESMLLEDRSARIAVAGDHEWLEESLASSLPRLESLLTQYSKQLSASERRSKHDSVPRRGLSRITIGLLSIGMLLFTLAVLLGAMYAWSATKLSTTLMVPSLLVVLGGIHSSFDRKRFLAAQNPSDSFSSEREQLHRASDLLSVLDDLSDAMVKSREQTQKEFAHLEALRDEVSFIEQSKAALTDEVSASRKALHSLQEELEAERRSIESARTEWNELSGVQSGLQRDLELSRSELESVQGEAASARLELERLVSEVKSFAERCEGLQANHLTLEEEIEKRKEQIQELESSESELQGLIQSLRAMAEMERHQSEIRFEEISRLDTHLEAKQKQLKEEVDAIHQFKEQEEQLVVALQENRSSLEKEIAALEEQIAELAIVKENIGEELMAISRQVQVDESHQLAFERSQLLALTLSLITSEQSEIESLRAKQLVEIVQNLESAKLRLTNEIAALEASVACILGEKVVAEDDRNRLLDSLSIHRNELIEMENAIEQKIVDLESIESQIRQTLEYRSALEIQNEFIHTGLAERRSEEEALKVSNEALLRLAADYQGVVDDLAAQQRLLSGEYQRLSKDVFEKETVLQSLETSIQTAHQLLKELTDQSVGLSDSIESQSQLCLEKTAQAERLLDHLDELAHRRTELELLLVDLEAKSIASREEIEELEQQKDQLVSTLEYTRDMTAQFEDRSRTLDSAAAASEAMLRDLESRRTFLENEHSQLESIVLELNRRIDLANSQIPDLEATLVSLESDRQQLNLDLSEGQGVIASLQTARRDEQSQLDQLRIDAQLEMSRLAELRYECDEMLEKQKHLQEELSASEASLLRKEGDAKACQIEIERLSEERLALKREQILLSDSVESLERQKQELARVEAELSKSTRQLIELQDKALIEQQKLSTVESNKRAVESQLQFVQEDVKRVEFELDQANSKLDKANRDLHQAEVAIQTKKGDVIMVEKKLTELEQNKTTLDLEVARMMEEATEASKVCGQWRAYKETLSRELDQLSHEKQSMSNEVVGLEFRRKELQSAIRELETTKTSLAATAKAAQEEVNKETKKVAEQRQAFQDLSNEIERGRRSLTLLEGEQREQKLVVDRLEKEASQLEKSVLESSRILAANQQETALMQQRLEMARLGVQNEEARIREINREFAGVQGDLNKCLAKVDALRVEMEQLDQKKSEWEAGEESRNKLLEQHERMEQRHLEYVEEIKVLEQHISLLEAGLLQKEGELTSVKQAVSAIEGERERQQKDLAALQLSLSEMEERKKGLDEELMSLARDQVMKKEAVDCLTATRQEQERASSDLADRILRLTEDIGHLSRQRMGLESEIQGKQSQIESLSHDLLGKEKKLVEEETKLVHVRTEVARLEEKLNESKFQVEAIQQAADLERVDFIRQVGLREIIERANTWSISENADAPIESESVPSESVAADAAEEGQQILEAVQEIQDLADEVRSEHSLKGVKPSPSLWDSILG